MLNRYLEVIVVDPLMPNGQYGIYIKRFGRVQKRWSATNSSYQRIKRLIRQYRIKVFENPQFEYIHRYEWQPSPVKAILKYHDALTTLAHRITYDALLATEWGDVDDYLSWINDRETWKTYLRLVDEAITRAGGVGAVYIEMIRDMVRDDRGERIEGLHQ